MTVYMLISNTPVLPVLSLTDCNKRIDFHIDIAQNSHFKSLMIGEALFVEMGTRIDMKAPSAKEFMFNSGLLPRASYNNEISFECEKVTLLLDSLFLWSSEVQKAKSDDEADQEEQEGEEG
ncbi:hypothetical protein ACH5RR_014868 [Cinchona calisaya]|uniref:Uncharacterized protein n=1 Tax=Cinchona calisaya TaxID=153742 RepID=A0ABD2ZSB3_9GENT